MHPPRRVTGPAALPVGLAEMKAHLRILHDEEDALIEGFLAAAVEHFDGWSGTLGRCLVTQTWEQQFDRWERHFCLAFPNVTNVRVTYADAAGDVATVAADDFVANETARTAEVWFWPTFARPELHDRTDRPVTVTYDAGFGAPGDVPAPIRTAIMMLAAHLYEHREAVSEAKLAAVPIGIERLASGYRRVG